MDAVRRFALLLLVLWLLAGQARAAEEGAGGTLRLPSQLERASPQAAELVDPEQEGYGLAAGAAELWNQALEEVKTALFSGVKSVAAIMAGVVLLGVVESTAPDRRGVTGQYVTIAGALWITAVAAGDLSALIGLGRETVVEVSRLSKVLLPALAAATAAAGSVTAASVRQVAAVIFSDVLLTVIEGLLLPMVYLYIGVAAAETVLEGETLSGIGRLLKKIIVWSLSGLLMMFTTYLTVSGAVAGAADAAAVKLAKSAVSSVVPVVGSILAEAAESVLAGAGVLKGLTGVFGMLAVLGFCLTPFLRLLGQYLLYQGAALVAATAGAPKLVGLVRRLGDAFGLVLAMTASSALLLIISLVSSLTAVTP